MSVKIAAAGKGMGQGLMAEMKALSNETKAGRDRYQEEIRDKAAKAEKKMKKMKKAAKKAKKKIEREVTHTQSYAARLVKHMLLRSDNIHSSVPPTPNHQHQHQ